MKIIPFYMLPVAAVLAIIIDPTPAKAMTPIHKACDAGVEVACMELAYRTGGQCASPGGLGGCAYDSRHVY